MGGTYSRRSVGEYGGRQAYGQLIWTLVAKAGMAHAYCAFLGRMQRRQTIKVPNKIRQCTYQCLLVVGQQNGECAAAPAAAGTVGDSLAASWAVMRSAWAGGKRGFKREEVALW